MNNAFTNKFLKDLIDLADTSNSQIEEVIRDIVQKDYRKLVEQRAIKVLDQAS